MNYVTTMKERSKNAMQLLHRDVTDIRFTDFPDHANVGDSAIALGQLAFWREAGIRVRSTHSVTTQSNETYLSEVPVAIHGGGNFGGLYRSMSQHRYSLSERLLPDSLLIQEPQSVHFPTENDQQEFVDRMSRRTNLRIAVRDNYSRDLLSLWCDNVELVPDSVHMLGPISSPPPVSATVILARRDKESNLGSSWAGLGAVDWLDDPWHQKAETWLRWRMRHSERLRRLSNKSNDAWANAAEQRFERGVEILAKGETIITDRLHAVLIGLQMGRRVIAVDNNNQKISRYIETWFDFGIPSLRVASNLAEAIDIGLRE